MRKCFVIIVLLCLLVLLSSGCGKSNHVYPPPTTPSGLTATAISPTRIDLSWTDNSNNENCFRIERKSGSGGTYVQITEQPANCSTHTDSYNVSYGTTYYYKLRAYNSYGYSDYSNEVSVTIPDFQPKTPSGLTATAKSKYQIDLSWTDNSNNEDGFRIERSTWSIWDNSIWVQIAEQPANCSTLGDYGLMAGTTYNYRIRAYNSYGNSGYSNQVSVTTPGWPPSAPSLCFVILLNYTSVLIDWTNGSRNTESFSIERKTGIDGTYVQIAVVPAIQLPPDEYPPIGDPSYIDHQTLPETTYYYRVRAYNTWGYSEYSQEYSVTTQIINPATPSELTATVKSSTQIDLSWTDNSNNEDCFSIERKIGINGTFDGTFIQLAEQPANSTTYTDFDNVSSGTKYFYRIRAYSSCEGYSEYSNETSVTTY